MNKMQEQLLEFHKMFEHRIGEFPELMDEKTFQLRCSLMREEYHEFKEAHEQGNLVESVDGLMDLLYVTIGTCVSMGFDIQPFFDEVHRSNMSKVWPDGSLHKRADGKTIKPDTYSPADIVGVLGLKAARQGTEPLPHEREVPEFEFLETTFLEAMNDIGRYGAEKYGEQSFQHRALNGDRSRSHERVSRDEICIHAMEHYEAYMQGEKHDHFKTRKHQLAAVAFNAMMEFYFEGLESEEPQ